MEFTKEMLEKAKKVESAEALQALAKENNYDMSAEEAEAYFAQLHKSGELSDEELENVSGGGCRKNGHLVVSLLYSCQEWRCKTDNRERVPRGYRDIDTGKVYDWCPVCHSSVNCGTCLYCKYEKGLWLCYNSNK